MVRALQDSESDPRVLCCPVLERRNGSYIISEQQELQHGVDFFILAQTTNLMLRPLWLTMIETAQKRG